MRNRNTGDCECNNACKIDEYLGIKNSCERRLISKLVLQCEDEILNTTLLNDNK